jgi:capsular polysaccharide biosynthesis protein
VELNEAFRRIVLQHVRLIACFVITGLAVGALVHHTTGKTFTTSARLALDTQDPKSRTEAAAIADMGQAIATSPAQIRAALNRSHVHRDINGVAHRVAVRPLGTSGVLELSYSDRSAQGAKAVADALAAQLIRTRLAISSGKLRQALGASARQIDSFNRQIAELDAKAAFDPAAAAQRDLLAQQRSAIESERASLLSSAALQPKPSIISTAEVPAHATTSGLIPYMTLGAILGLILALGTAGLVEMIRPTVVGEDALAREFDAPLLGTLSGVPGEATLLGDTSSLADRIRLAGEGSHVHGVWLVGAGPSVDLSSLAVALTRSGESNGSSRGAKPARDLHAHGVTIDVFDVHTWSPNGGGAGIVLVSPHALKKEDLIETNRLLELSRLPVLGLITYDGERPRRAGVLPFDPGGKRAAHPAQQSEPEKVARSSSQ